jgi:hypothetical protein
LAVGVDHAVGCELAGGERQVRGSVFESRGDGMLGGVATYGGQVGGAEVDDDSTLGRLGKGLIEKCGDVAALVVAAGMALTGPIDEGVGDVGIVDDEPPESRAVVGTEQPEANAIRKGLVEQQLASSALDELLWSATRPDRFADAS